MGTRKEMVMEDLTLDCIPEQRLALSIFGIHFFGDGRFVFERVKVIDNGIRIVLAEWCGSKVIFLPVFHDFPLAWRVLLQLWDEAEDRKRLLAMCASDASVILYQISDFDFEAATTEQGGASGDGGIL
jgi:hypothetical protein